MEASPAQKTIYGADVKLDPIGGFPIEQGSGALPLAQQRENFCASLPPPEADEMRRKMGLPVPSEIAAAAAKKEADAEAHRQEAEAALAAKPNLEKQVTDLTAANKALTAENSALKSEAAAATSALHPGSTVEEKSNG